MDKNFDRGHKTFMSIEVLEVLLLHVPIHISAEFCRTEIIPILNDAARKNMRRNFCERRVENQFAVSLMIQQLYY